MTLREKLPGLAKKGLTQAQAARQLGVSRQRISQVTAKLKLSFTPSVPAIPNAKRRLQALAKKGLTRTEAARALGVSWERVNRLADEHGLDFPPRWSRPRLPTTELGRVLQRARLAAGYTYTQLATRSGLDRHQLASTELGRVRRPMEKTLRRLANALRGHTSYDALARAAYGSESRPRRARRR